MLGGDFDLEGLLGGKPDLPGHVGCCVVQVLLGAVLVVRQLNQHALSQATVQIKLQGITPRTRQLHPRAPGLGGCTCDAEGFSSQQGLNSRGAG